MNWAEKCKIEAFYVVCSGPNHYCGGTSKGLEFLQKNPIIPADFLGSLRAGKGHSRGRSRIFKRGFLKPQFSIELKYRKMKKV